MGDAGPTNRAGHVPSADGWRILDVLVDDAAGKRFLIRAAGGEFVEAVEPPEEAQTTLAFRERLKEKAARARLVEHGCLVPTAGCVEDAGKLFIVEPHVGGVSLAELMKSQGPLDADAVLEVGGHVARALDALHRSGLVHGWVRPAAIVVTEQRALLRDAGVEHPKGEAAMPPEFMSPEQLSDERSLRPESDFFSLGATLFAAAVGRPPFLGASGAEVAAAVREGRTTFPSGDEPRLSRNISFLFAKLLAADPELRPRSADELISDIDSVRAGRAIERVTVAPPSTPGPPRPRRPRRRNAALIAAAGAAVLLVVAGVLLVLPRDRHRPTEPGALASGTSGPARTSAPAGATTVPAGIRQPAKTPTREELAAELYRGAEQFALAHPGQFDDVVRRYREVADKHPGTQAALKAEQKATDWTLRKSGAQLAQFDDVQAEADKLVKDKRFGAAAAVFNRYEVLLASSEGRLTPELRDKIQRQVGFIRAKAAEAFARDGDEASKAVRTERYEDAITIYDAVVTLYGIDEHVQRARKELALLRPLLAARDKVAAEKLAKELEAAYRETAAEAQKKVKAFDLEGAVADAGKLLARLRGSALEPNAARHLAHLRLLLGLKRRVVEKINGAEPKLRSESLAIRATASVIESADASGITLRSAAGAERRAWADLSDWEKYSIARSVSDLDSRDDLTALGLLSIEQGNLTRAADDLRRAQTFGATVDDLLARVKTGGVTAPVDDDRPGRMLVEARALVAEKKWLDALALLVPLKEKHAASSYAVREKLDEINALLEQSSRGVARADVERDIAAGVEAALLAAGIDDWERTGRGWAFKDGRVSCDNAAEHDVDLLKPAQLVPAYRLAARCRVLAGNGLLIRVASDGDSQYDFWLGLGDRQKTGLWFTRGGKVEKSAILPVTVIAGEWVDVRAVVTARHIRVECAGQSASMPGYLKTDAGAKRSYGFVTRQQSKAEFEDFRVRVLREQ